MVEVDVGQRREQVEEHNAVGLTIGPAEGAEARQILADALELVDQQILQIRRYFILAANFFWGPAQPAPASVRLVCSYWKQNVFRFLISNR